MKSPNEKKIQKLRKGHFWPSIFFFLLSILLACIASALSMTMIVSYFAQDRLQAACLDMQQVQRQVSQRMAVDDDGAFLTRLVQDYGIYNAACILDDDGELLSGFGGQTYDLSTPIFIPAIDQHQFFADQSTGSQLLDEEGELDLLQILRTQLAVLRSTRFQFFNPLKFIPKDIACEVPVWITAPISPNRTLIAKFRLFLYRSDFLLAMTIGMIAVGVMLPPILFLFINVLTNLLNQRRMTKLLYTDPLTAGNSWIYFEHYGNNALGHRRLASKGYAVVDLSVQKYRTYCICHGAKAGAKLLSDISSQLSASLGHGEYCAHYGNSSFALLIKGSDRDKCEARLQGLLHELTHLPEHHGILFDFGVCLIDPAALKKDKKLNLDIAHYHNRACAARATITDDSLCGIAFFDQSMLDEQLWEHKVSDKMEQALKNEEFQVYLQPKYNPVTNRLAGAEALVRWMNKEDGFIPPGRFIPIFERNGFITRLDDYMISHVARLQAQWLKEGKQVVPVSVNVSRAHFATPNLAEHICALVDVYDLPHHLLEIELTESAFFDDQSALLGTVERLHAMGFEVSMDDFGAGYSSLNSLKDLPLDVLKLDAGFFRGEDGAKRGEIVVSQAIHLAKQLNMQIVAEGIEKQEQVDFLARNGCDMIQGYFYAKPMPAEEYSARLEG